MFDTMRISSKMTGQNLPTSSLTSSQSLTASQNAGILQPRLMKPGRFVYPMKTAVNSPLNHRWRSLKLHLSMEYPIKSL